MNLLIALLISHSAFAGTTTVGGGGLGVVCSSSTEVLDLFEARRLYGFKPDFGSRDDNSDPQNIRVAARLAAERFNEVMKTDRDAEDAFKFAVSVANAINANMAEFIIQPLKSTGDSGPLATPLPRGCHILQAARFIKRRHLLPEIEIYEPVWNEFDGVDVQALVLHEVFHTVFKRENDTVALRQFVSYLSAPTAFREKNKALFKRLYETKRALPNGFLR